MSFSTGSGGGGSISGSSDVALSNPADNDGLHYSSSVSKWVNKAPTSPIIVKWSTTTGWGTYSTDTNRVRYFHSQNDISATAPTYYSAFDVWFRHPEAV